MTMFELALLRLLQSRKITMQLEGLTIAELGAQLHSSANDRLLDCTLVLHNPDLSDAEKIKQLEQLLPLF